MARLVLSCGNMLLVNVTMKDSENDALNDAVMEGNHTLCLS